MLILVVYDKKRREKADSRSVRQRGGRKLILKEQERDGKRDQISQCRREPSRG